MQNGNWFILLCTFCELRNTKHSSFDSGILVYNVCAVSVESNCGYEEELKKVGICKKCSKKKCHSTHQKRKYKKVCILCFKTNNKTQIMISNNI